MKTQLTTKMGFDLTVPPPDPAEKGATKEFHKPPLPLKLRVEDYLPQCK
jgi:hypothetical protein